MYRLWFIDEDPAQRNSFRQEFKSDFEVVLIEATGGRTPDELIEEAFEKKVDLLIIDYQMESATGFNGNAIEKRIKQINPHFPVLVSTSHVWQALDYIDDPNITYDKDIWSWENPGTLVIFKKRLSSLINNYNTSIINAKAELLILDNIRKAQWLSPIEEDRFIELNNFLDYIHGNGEHLSRTFYSVDTNKKLDELIEKTESLLDKIQ